MCSSQIFTQYEYYVGNRSVSVEGVALEHFSDTFQETSPSYFYSITRHAVFHLFMSDNSKQYAYTTAAHIKQIINMLKIMF